jgi:serine/threonine protein kinase
MTDSNESPSIEIKVEWRNKNQESNEEEKEDNTSASESLVKEVDWDGEEIKFSSFQLLDKLGKGNFGEVFKVIMKKDANKEDPKAFALKAMKKSQIIGNNQLKYVISELNIMKQLKHPFIVALNYAFQTPKYLYLAMEYWSGRDLSWHLDKKGHFEEQKAKLCIAEIILAIEYLHDKNIIYRDLKPSNILVSEDGHLKLVDFGLAKEGVMGMDYAQTFCGSPAYLAPELLKEKKFNKSSDIYQIGVLLFEMLTGKPPFFKTTRESLFEWIKYSYNLEVPAYVKKVSIDLLGKLLNKIPEKRLGVNNMQDLKDHEFFNDIDWELLYHKKLTKEGIFDLEEIRQAEMLQQDSLDFDNIELSNLEHHVNFYDKDYFDEEDSYKPLGVDYEKCK